MPACRLNVDVEERGPLFCFSLSSSRPSEARRPSGSSIRLLRLSVRPSVHPSVHPSVCRSVCLSVCLSLSLSLCLSVAYRVLWTLETFPKDSKHFFPRHSLAKGAGRVRENRALIK